MSLEEYMREKLWPILVEVVHAAVMYPGHKAYIRDVILREKPDVKASELVTRLNIPFGEALVILHELSSQSTSQS